MDELAQTVLYHQVEPQATQSLYQSFDNVDFVINAGEGRALLKNSVRILGDLRINSTGAAGPTGTRATGGIGFDRNAGAHCFVDSIQISMDQLGLVENIQNYPRYVSMVGHATDDRLDTLNSDRQCELKGHVDAAPEALAQGILTYVEAGGTAVTDDVDFSIKPVCGLNRMSGGDLAESVSGSVTLTANLARDVVALRGRNQVAASTYAISNLRCTFQSVPAPAKREQVIMRTLHNVKSNLLSGNGSISCNVPAICSGVSISFVDTAREGAVNHNSYALEQPQGISEVQYLFNDTTNSLVTYVLQDRTEMLERFIDSLEITGHNQVGKDVFRANQGFGLGLPFDGMVDLSKNRFTLQVASDANNRPSSAFLYFHSQVVV